jgi:hypothetical protein
MANPDPSPETRFKAGESGNPGGLSREMKALIAENAEKAVRIRAEFLDYVLSLMEPDEEGNRKVPINSDTLKLLKDSEDRGLGAPKQTLAGDAENPIGVSLVERVIVDTKATD